MIAALRRRVRRRARGRCEYCRMPVRFDPFPAHVDHVIAGIDPVTETLVPLFNPRAERWANHFRWDGPLLVGKTATARATIRVLAINAGRRVAVRTQLMAEGAY